MSERSPHRKHTTMPLMSWGGGGEKGTKGEEGGEDAMGEEEELPLCSTMQMIIC